jgi:hypothetical protein
MKGQHTKAPPETAALLNFRNYEIWFEIRKRRQAGALQRLLFWASTGWTMQSGNLLTDDWILRSFIDIDLSPMRVLLGHVGIGEDCFNRTLRNTRIAIDTCISVYVETISQLMKSFNRTNSSAVGVLAVDA